MPPTLPPGPETLSEQKAGIIDYHSVTRFEFWLHVSRPARTEPGSRASRRLVCLHATDVPGRARPPVTTLPRDVTAGCVSFPAAPAARSAPAARPAAPRAAVAPRSAAGDGRQAEVGDAPRLQGERGVGAGSCWLWKGDD